MPAAPQFRLRSLTGAYLRNTEYEHDEQRLLASRLRDGDRVLQLGGNIGTSCIAAAKTRTLAANVCVEPSDTVVQTLRRNISEHGVDVRVVHGIIGGTGEACAQKRLMGVGGDPSHNDWGASVTADGGEGQAVRCTTLQDVAPPGGFTVLFADCEGCFPGFVEEHAEELARSHDLHTIVYERDAGADYGSVERFCKDHDFRCSGGFHTLCVRGT